MRSLDVRGDLRVGDSTLLQLALFRELQVVRLAGSSVTGCGVTALASWCRTLVRISLPERASDSMIDALQWCRSLAHFSASRCAASESSLRLLVRSCKLQTITAPRCAAAATDCSFLVESFHLRKLNLQRVRANTAQLAQLICPKAIGLESLNLSHNRGLDDHLLSQLLAAMPHLRSLDASGCHLSDAALSAATQCHGLGTLRVADCAPGFSSQGLLGFVYHVGAWFVELDVRGSNTIDSECISDLSRRFPHVCLKLKR